MFYQLFLLFLRGSILQTILAELTNLPSSYDLLQAFKQNIREKGSQEAVSEQLNHGSLDVMATSTTNWVVSSGFSDKTCSTLATTQGFRTDCLKDAAKTSSRVSCNSTTITLDEYFYSTTCKGKVSSRTVAKTSTCLSTQFTGETLSYACITSPNDPPLPTGDWFTFISYADYTCSQKDIFYGWKNGVCLNSLGSSSMKYSYPTLYSYSSSSTCSGTSSTSDLSSLTATCNKNYAGSSSHYYYLHSDGSTVSTATPTAQPTLRPSTSTKTTKPTAKSASKPTMKPSASKPTTTVKPSTSKPTLKTTIKPTVRNGPTVKPTPKPTFKPTTKNMAIDGNTSSSDSESTPSNSLSHYDNDSSHVMVILSVCLGVLVVGLLLWHCCRREHEDHKNTGQYVKVTRNEEKWDNISEIPEVL